MNIEELNKAKEHITHLESIVAKLPTVTRVVTEECGECGGSGWTTHFPVRDSEACEDCHGSGKVPVKAFCFDGGCDDGKLCGHIGRRGYATKKVLVAPGDEVWSTEMFKVKAVAEGELLEWETRGYRWHELSDCYADELTAKLLGAKK